VKWVGVGQDRSSVIQLFWVLRDSHQSPVFTPCYVCIQLQSWGTSTAVYWLIYTLFPPRCINLKFLVHSLLVLLFLKRLRCFLQMSPQYIIFFQVMFPLAEIFFKCFILFPLLLCFFFLLECDHASLFAHSCSAKPWKVIFRIFLIPCVVLNWLWEVTWFLCLTLEYPLSALCSVM
jgi:hypothetical protein